MIVTLFRSRVKPEAQEEYARWATRSMYPQHVEAKKKGRNSFYIEYRVQVCTVQRTSASPTRAESVHDRASITPGD
jgi:hypothetical protein